MARPRFPDHELVPKPPPGKAGKKRDGRSDTHEILKRVVTVGKLMHIRGMSLTEVYQWNKDPARGLHPDTGEPIPNMWNFSFRQIHEISVKARKLGANLLLNDYDEALRRMMRIWFDLKDKSEQGGDFRAAIVCAAQIAKLQDNYIGKMGKSKTEAVTQLPHQWADAMPAEALKIECRDVTEADYDRIIGPPPKP